MSKTCRLVRPAKATGPIAVRRLLYRLLCVRRESRGETNTSSERHSVSYSCCRLVRPWNAPSAIAVIWLLNKVKFCRAKRPENRLGPTRVSELSLNSLEQSIVSHTPARTSFTRSRHSQRLKAGKALERPVGNRGDLVAVHVQDLQAGQASKGNWSDRR
jgi:hypothetical protein